MDPKNLENRLVNRESRESLVQRGILRSFNMDPFVSSQISQLQRDKNTNLMNEKLRSRPNINVLIEKKILRDYDIGLNGKNNNNNSCNNNDQSNQHFDAMQNEQFICSPQTNDHLSTFNASNGYLRPKKSNTNHNSPDNEINRNSKVILDPSEKQKIEYMLSDHLVTRPSAIDLLNNQILCPELQYSDHIKNLDGNTFSYFDELSKRRPKQTDFQKKTKKYNFHDVTPDKIKLSHSNNNSHMGKGFRGVNIKAASNSNHINSPPGINQNHQDMFKSHHKRLIEQQTIYLNYEVARRNALISQLKKEKDELFNIKYMLESHNLNQSNSAVNTNNAHNSSIHEAGSTNGTSFNDSSTIPLQFLDVTHQSTPISHSNNMYDDNLNDASTLNSDPMFTYRPSTDSRNLLDSTNYSVDDYLRKFDINVPYERRMTDSFVGLNNEYFNVTKPIRHQYLYSENQSGVDSSPPSYLNYSFNAPHTNNSCDMPFSKNNSFHQLGYHPFNSFSDVTFDNQYNTNSNYLDSSYTNSNNSDIINARVYNGFSTARNSNDLQYQQFSMCAYDTSQDHSSLGVAQMDFNSLVAFYELLADMSRNSKQ